MHQSLITRTSFYSIMSGVVVIGSSGGGTATLGHTDPVELLTAIHRELGRIQTSSEPLGISYALFVSCPKSLDSVNDNDTYATLWTVGISSDTTNEPVFNVKPVLSAPLKDVNQNVEKLSSFISSRLEVEKIKGCISISSDPSGVNLELFQAIAKHGIPVTGSGGTSLSKASTINGLRFVGNIGGSVATTTYTRAVSFCHALATEWNEDYHPYNKSRNDPFGVDVDRPGIRSILEACLPAFIMNCIACEFLSRFGVLSHQLETQLRYHVLPTISAVVTTTSLSPEHKSTSIMSAVIASVSCRGSVLSGLLAGWLVSFLLGEALFLCIKLKIPATMTNIVLGGFIGIIIALGLELTGISQVLSQCTEVLRNIIKANIFIQENGGISGYGFLMGCIFVYGSKVGWYHSILLPVILLEMELGHPSIWGAIDECTLVLVSAGICAANVLTKKTALSMRGLLINLTCGDFIEVAYKDMDESKVVNLFAYLAGGISTEILYLKRPQDVLSSAYLPFPVSIMLAKDTSRISLAMFSAFSISFIGILVKSLLSFAFYKKEKDKTT